MSSRPSSESPVRVGNHAIDDDQRIGQVLRAGPYPDVQQAIPVGIVEDRRANDVVDLEALRSDGVPEEALLRSGGSSMKDWAVDPPSEWRVAVGGAVLGRDFDHAVRSPLAVQLDSLRSLDDLDVVDIEGPEVFEAPALGLNDAVDDDEGSVLIAYGNAACGGSVRIAPDLESDPLGDPDVGRLVAVHRGLEAHRSRRRRRRRRPGRRCRCSS